MVSSFHSSVRNSFIHKILKTQNLLKKVPFFAPNICALLILGPPSLKHPSPPLKVRVLVPSVGEVVVDIGYAFPLSKEVTMLLLLQPVLLVEILETLLRTC